MGRAPLAQHGLVVVLWNNKKLAIINHYLRHYRGIKAETTIITKVVGGGAGVQAKVVLLVVGTVLM